MFISEVFIGGYAELCCVIVAGVSIILPNPLMSVRQVSRGDIQISRCNVNLTNSEPVPQSRNREIMNINIYV